MALPPPARRERHVGKKEQRFGDERQGSVVHKRANSTREATRSKLGSASVSATEGELDDDDDCVEHDFHDRVL